MYALDEKLKAIKLYNETKSFAVVKRMLGYPSNAKTLKEWINNCENEGLNVEHRGYTTEEIQFAIEYYKECQSARVVVKDLGYPQNVVILYRWIAKYSKSSCRERKKNVEYSEDEKERFVKLFLESNLSQISFSRNYDFTPQTLGNWIRRYSCEVRKTNEMPSNNFKDKEINKVVSDSIDNESNITTVSDEINRLKKEIASLKAEKSKNDAKLKQVQLELKQANLKVEQAQLEYDILEKAAELLKKEKGININSLTNREKAIVVNALRYKYKLVELLKAIKMAKSSYEYQNKHMNDDKYEDVRKTIVEIFNNNYKAFGYRRIHASLKNDGIIVSEKVVRRLMKEAKIRPYIPRMKKYSSYEGEISPAVEDLYKHDFKSSTPYDKLVTDITEFSLKDGKVYLSPIIDLFDGAPITWTIGTSPNKQLTNTMLMKLHDIIPSTAKPTIHSDRGCHYRIPDWINLMNEYQYTRSMSRKGCSADNSACEGYFGILKREFFHNHDWSNCSRNEFINELDRYLIWFKTKRIKQRLGFISPVDYRNQATL